MRTRHSHLPADDLPNPATRLTRHVKPDTCDEMRAMATTFRSTPAYATQYLLLGGPQKKKETPTMARPNCDKNCAIVRLTMQVSFSTSCNIMLRSKLCCNYYRLQQLKESSSVWEPAFRSDANTALAPPSQRSRTGVPAVWHASHSGCPSGRHFPQNACLR